ncbi:MAG: tRNA threonylcarbamoyladenosine biosynthesis protein TsaB [Verrucomicrobiae bacterium]|nr:tRNA threonylcarbamoyladenosine biosynthesis protein TsaB [Verrucomicrobiae bacterium]
MITLAIDTSTTRGAVAVLHDDRPVGEEHFGRDGLFPALEKLNPGQFESIVVGVGPGSFTGIRAGIAAAKGLALPGRLPVKAISSFDALALTALPHLPRDCPQICVLADARRDEVYFALYDRNANPTHPCRLGALEEIEIHNPIWFISAEMEKYRDALRETFGGFATICHEPVFPSAAALGWLGRHRASQLPLEPIYLRETEYKKVAPSPSSPKNKLPQA